MCRGTKHECLFAYTAPGAVYPEYINVSARDDKLEVTVRGPAKLANTHEFPWDMLGDTVLMTLPRDQVSELISALRKGLLVTQKDSADGKI